jgi:hypothetical protein
MHEFTLLNLLTAVLATAGGVFTIVWLFAAPVEKSKSRGLGMVIGAIGYYFFGSRRDGGDA